MTNPYQVHVSAGSETIFAISLTLTRCHGRLETEHVAAVFTTSTREVLSCWTLYRVTMMLSMMTTARREYGDEDEVGFAAEHGHF